MHSVHGSRLDLLDLPLKSLIFLVRNTIPFHSIQPVVLAGGLKMVEDGSRWHSGRKRRWIVSRSVTRVHAYTKTNGACAGREIAHCSASESVPMTGESKVDIVVLASITAAMSPIPSTRPIICELHVVDGLCIYSQTFKGTEGSKASISTFPGHVDHKLLQRLQLLSATLTTIRPHSAPSMADGEFEADAEESTPVMTPHINRVWNDSREVRGSFW